jgi:hypothetical protein
MLESGYFTIGRFRGVPLRVHVLTPLGALFFTGLRFAPGAWLAFFLLVLLHEIGHALLVMRFGLFVSSIDVHAYGGVCHWSGRTTEARRIAIAWGGVIAQLVVLASTLVLVGVLGNPHTMFLREVVDVFTRTNLWVMAINLIPARSFDGAEAWKIVGEVRRRLASRPAPERDLSPDEARRVAKAFEDAVRRR